jgi:hypothetical protein
MEKTSVEYGPNVKLLMGLKLARLAYVSGGLSTEGANAILDEPENREVRDELTQHAFRWVLRTLEIIRVLPGMSCKTDEELAQEIMDVIGMDPTTPCRCCGEYH